MRLSPNDFGRTSESSCLDVGRVTDNFYFCIVPMGTLVVPTPPQLGKGRNNLIGFPKTGARVLSKYIKKFGLGKF